MAGLHFYNLDLHTHTPASKCYLDKKQTALEIVQAAQAKGLDGIAVTDHNTAEWIDIMKKAAEGTGLVIFPGVEISLGEGHLLAIFDPSVNQKQVENLLGAVDITADEYGHSETVTTKSLYDVVDKIHERGGLAVLAHIDQHKGVFHDGVKPKDGCKVIVAAPLSKMLNEAAYDAVECANDTLPDGFDEAHQVKRKPAFYQASDNPDPRSPTKHSLEGLALRYSKFNVDQINLEGLRQCFVDPETRIRSMNVDVNTAIPRIVSMAIGESGFLGRQKFEFHEGLNSLIGGKGVGKSLAIEFLRFGLEQSSNDADIRRDHIKKLNKRLMPGNSIEIVYQMPNGVQFQITRVFEGADEKDSLDIQGTTTCINLSTGEQYSGDIPRTFQILAYSQTEVINIAEDKTAQLGLIDQFIDTRDSEQEIVQLSEKLRENDTNLDKSLQAKEKLEECEREINTLKLKIGEINNALLNPLFKQMKAGEAKKDALEAYKQFASNLGEQLKGWVSELDDTDLPETPEDLSEDVLLNTQIKKAEQLRGRVAKIIAGLVADAAKAENDIAASAEIWMPEFEKTRSEYNQLLKEIGGDQQDKERERKRLDKRKNENDKEAAQYRSQRDALQSIWDERQRLLDRLEKVYEKIYKTRKDKYDQLTGLSENKLNLVLTHAADRSAFEEKLVDLLKGGAAAPTVSDRKKIAQNITPRRFVELVIDRKSHDLAGEAEIGESLAKRVIEKLRSSDDFSEVLALQHNCYPGDVPSIHYCKEGGEYAELSELSIGQKCTALLIIALCDGSMPVVIDQPEDALDIISVWEDIAKKLRRGKNSRQFILTTHNSSVAVSADSDQFIILKAGANSGRVVAAGAIDRPEVKQAVIDHMEGGKEPYRLRSKKYNLD